MRAGSSLELAALESEGFYQMNALAQARETVLLALDPQHFPSLRNARQTLIPGTPHPQNPVLRPRAGHWDGTRCKVYGTVLVDPRDGLFKMWYSGGTDTPESVRRECGSPRNVGYAWSEDGVRWNRPELGLIEHNGRRDNNVVLLDAQAPSVFLLDDQADPDHRFMMITEAGQLTNENLILFSPDGIRWTPLEQQPVESGDWGAKTHEPFSILYDVREPNPARRWKGYSLLHLVENGYRGRAVGYFEAADPAHWVEYPHQPILSAFDGVESEIHIPHVSRFHDTYVMLYDAMEPNHHTQTEVAVSDDGVQFRRVQNGVKVIPNGPPGSVNAGKVCVSPRSMLVHEGKIWWYHTVSCDTYQTAPRGLTGTPWYRYTNLVQWREDGMACIERAADAGADGAAELTSAPLHVEGGQLGDVWLNAATANGDAITIETLDEATGEVVARARPWSGDELRARVQWVEPPLVPAHRRVRFRLAFRGDTTRVYAVGIGAARRAEAASSSPATARAVSQRAARTGERWRFRAEAKITSSPIVWRDQVLVTSWDHHVYSVDRATGTLRWKLKTGNAVTSSPAVYGSSGYVGSRDGFVYAFDLESGTLRWKSPVDDGKKFNGFNPNGAWIDSTPTVGAYAPRWNALVRDERTQRWTRRMEADAPRWLYLGAHDRQMHAFDLETGAEMWRTPTFNWILSRAAVEDYTVYFGSMDGHVYALDAQCGAMKWRYRAGRHLRYAEQVVPGSVVCEAVCGSPLVSGGLVYCGADDGFLYALDATTGEERWHARTGKWIWGRPQLAHDVLVVTSADGHVYGLEPRTGRELWRRATGNANYADVTGGPDAVLIASTDGRLYELDPRSGSVRWSFDAGTPLRAAPAVDPDERLAYVGTCGGELLSIAID